MAPGIHPPCTPTSSCTPQRCHPTPPPCQKPEECLRKSFKKGTKPCPSAVSIMATKSKSTCLDCSKAGGRGSVKKQNAIIKKYLKVKQKESKMIAQDRFNGTHRYERYLKRKNKPKPRDANPCCQGVGHRGVVAQNKPARPKGKKCIIL